MARIDDVLVSGTFGNIVFYRRMGKACARIKRDNIKQTAATKKRNINFGIAATTGKILRAGLINAMPYPTDRSMQSRFSGAIAKWLGQSDVNTLQPCDPVSYLSNFAFTIEDSFSDRFRVPFSLNLASTGVEVTIKSFKPVRNISAPAGTVCVHLVISVACVKPAKGVAAGYASQTIEIPYSDTEMPAETLDFAIPVDQGTLIVRAGRLVYLGVKNNQKSILNKKGFDPAGVINAAYC
jgi:hypothetical protein